MCRWGWHGDTDETDPQHGAGHSDGQSGGGNGTGRKGGTGPGGPAWGLDTRSPKLPHHQPQGSRSVSRPWLYSLWHVLPFIVTINIKVQVPDCKVFLFVEVNTLNAVTVKVATWEIEKLCVSSQSTGTLGEVVDAVKVKDQSSLYN